MSLIQICHFIYILSFQGHARRTEMELSDKSDNADNQTPVKLKLLVGPYAEQG